MTIIIEIVLLINIKENKWNKSKINKIFIYSAYKLLF